jgi:P pilus assembly chaperone PapD
MMVEFAMKRMIGKLAGSGFGRHAAMALFALSTVPARAEMVLSQVIVDLQPGKPSHDDIEVFNDSPERMYVIADPAQVQSPGTPAERRVTVADPAVSGLLVTPQRMVLEPGQRRIIRVAALLPRDMTERIYRVTVKPVAGPVTAETTALKVLLGYDVLVLLRPQRVAGEVTAARSGRKLVFRNESNTAQEIYEGKQCDVAGKNCKTLPSTRLYAGAQWTVDLSYDTPVEYRLTSGNGSSVRRF